MPIRHDKELDHLRRGAVAVKTRIGEQEYRAIALGTPDAVLELHDGELREKPPMSWEHGDVNVELGYLLRQQLNREEFRVRINEGRVRRSAGRYYVPDIVVVPASLAPLFRGQPGTLPVFRDPLPLVVEVWSQSTGTYDADSKIPDYMARGDREIWRLHPYERTLTAWVQQADGGYTETVYREGIVRPRFLPNVEIDLGQLFEA
jgi:Uma2 family endonuclease